MADTLFPRRQFLQSVLAAGFAGSSLCAAFADEELDWLEDVLIPPSEVPLTKRPLSPLLVDAEGRPITTRAAWEEQRTNLRKRWTEFLGMLTIERPRSAVKVVNSERVDGIVRELIEYEGEPGMTVPAYRLRPAESESGARLPGIVALHPTTAETIKPIAGLSGPEDKHSAVHLARAGFVVICPENFLWQNAATLVDAVEQFHQRHPNSLGMAKMLYDAQRAVDVLQQTDGVDPNRIGTFGHSLGAKEALYLAAFDERIRSAVASEGGIAFDSTNWDAIWYLGDAIRDPAFSLDHHQLLALAAPRPFLILAGESGPGAADGVRSWPYVAAAQQVYRLYGEQAMAGILNHRQGHSIPLSARERVIAWLRRTV